MKLGNMFVHYQFEEFDSDLARQLLRETSFITEFIVVELRKNKINGFDCGAISFMCKDKKENLRELRAPLYSILEVDVLFDPAYFKMDHTQKILYLYDFLYQSCKTLCSQKDWDFAPFEDAFLKLKENNYIGTHYVRLKCRQGKVTAQLYGVQEIDKLDFFLEFRTRKGVLCRKFLFRSFQNARDYSQHLGRLEWTENGEIILYNMFDKPCARMEISEEMLLNSCLESS